MFITFLFSRISAIFILLCLPGLAWSEHASPSKPPSIVTSTLKNGMKVCLKQTDYEEGMIVLQLFAMGGYAALSSTDRPSGILAADIAWESGLGEQTADQLSFDLYQDSIEIELKIQAFDRQIEAYCPTECLSKCLKIINLIFTHSKFEKEALKKVLAKNHLSIQTKAHTDLNARDIFLKTHTSDWEVLAPLTLPDLDYVNLTKAEKFFKQCFAHPSEFTLVVVGDFDVETVKSLIEKNLASIPPNPLRGPINPPSPAFPTGITRKDIYNVHRYKEILTRLTFPIPVKVTSAGTRSLELICHVIRDRLRKNLPLLAHSNKKLEVSYEFPFFPKLDEGWLTIQFNPQSQAEIDSFVPQIIELLEDLKSQGAMQEEIDNLKMCSTDQEMDLEENSYLLSLISNYYKANWDLADLFSEKDTLKIEKKVIKNDLNRYLQLDHYSIISIHP